MDIELLKREVEKHGLNATSKKYNIKKNKIKELINKDNKVIDSNRCSNSSNITNNTSNMMSLNDDEIKQLKLLINNSNDILKLIKKDTIKLKDNKTTVTSIRLNVELLKLVKDYSKKNNITLTNIINNALIDFLKNNSK